VDDRSFAGSGEAHLQPGPGAVPTPSASGQGAFIDDPRVLQILSTEHWSLLSARSLVYNEAFARAGMFLSFLSATLVALGLVATATGFSDGFLIIAAVILGIDLFVGLATVGRIASASNEDVRYLQAMNRVRNAYARIAPGVEDYFVSGHYDDPRTVLQVYGNARPALLKVAVHGFTTTPGMISVICSGVAGTLGAVVAMLLTHDDGIVALTAIAVAVIALVANVVFSQRTMRGFFRTMTVRFPPPDHREP
jgi:hypothetical protein